MIIKLRIRRQSTMRTKTDKMKTRSIAFNPFNSHGAMNLRGCGVRRVRHTVLTDNNGADIK